MAEAANNLGWVETIQEPIAREAMHILRELIQEFDLGKSGWLRISGSAHDAPHWMGIMREDHWRSKRTQVAKMLEGRGILEAVKSEYVGGYHAAGDETGFFLFVRAEEQPIRSAFNAFERRFQPRARAQDEARGRTRQHAVATTTKSEGTGDAFRKSYQTTLGAGLAWLTIVVVVLAAFFAAAKFIPGFGDLLIGVLEALSKKQ